MLKNMTIIKLASYMLAPWNLSSVHENSNLQNIYRETYFIVETYDKVVTSQKIPSPHNKAKKSISGITWCECFGIRVRICILVYVV